ncbi:BAG family molecular chaperone regulator 6-like, partial [Trifolium medium]|nr:BAG family molecular chaperone regulator 6-like [Trifolium medium]
MNFQGLHPSLRKIRKSLARELVTLQERLDSITADKYPQQQIQELDAKESVKESVEVPMSYHNGEHNQEQQEETTSQEDSSEVISDGKHQDQFYMEDNDGGSESPSHVDPASIEGTTPSVLLNRSVNEDISEVVADEALDSTSKLSDKADGECELKSEVIDIPLEVDKLDMTGLEELPVGVIDDVIGDSVNEGLDSDMHAMKVLPVGVLDEDAATSEETSTSYMHAMKVLSVGVLDEDATTSEETNTAFKELPVGVIDEDIIDNSASEALDSHMYAMKVLPVGVLDQDAATSKETSTSDMHTMKVLPVRVLDEDTSTCEETNFFESEVQAENE